MTIGYATRERFLQGIRQNPQKLRKILLRDGVFNEIVIARRVQLNHYLLAVNRGFNYGSDWPSVVYYY